MESYLSLESATHATRCRVDVANDATLPQLLNIYCDGKVLDVGKHLLEDAREIWIWVRREGGGDTSHRSQMKVDSNEDEDDEAKANEDDSAAVAKVFALKWILYNKNSSVQIPPNSAHFARHDRTNKNDTHAPLPLPTMTTINENLYWRADINDPTVTHMISEEDCVSIASFSSSLSFGANYAGQARYKDILVWDSGSDSNNTQGEGQINRDRDSHVHISVVLGDAKNKSNTPTKMWGIEALKSVLRVEGEADTEVDMPFSLSPMCLLMDNEEQELDQEHVHKDEKGKGKESFSNQSMENNNDNDNDNVNYYKTNLNLLDDTVLFFTEAEAETETKQQAKLMESLSLLSSSIALK